MEEETGNETPFQPDERVIVVDDKGRTHLLRLQPGLVTHQGRAGWIAHDRVIGRPPGLVIMSSTGLRYLVMRPSLDDYLLRILRRHTQIVYPKDLGTMLVEGNLFPGARILECGMGSAACSLGFLRFLGVEGELISYERREDCARLAQKNIDEFRREHGRLSASHRVEIRDIYETGIDERGLDLVLLDLPEPQRAVEAAAHALKINGVLLCWLPTVLQVFELVRGLQESPDWARIRTTETLVRSWHVAETSIRPAQRMVGHTGFLISARHVVSVDLEMPAQGGKAKREDASG